MPRRRMPAADSAVVAALEQRVNALAEQNEQQQAQLDQLNAIAFVINARLAELEASNAQLRAALALDPPPPTIGASWLTIKQAAFALGLSISGLRHRVAKHQIVAQRVGGKVLIDSASLGRKDAARVQA